MKKNKKISILSLLVMLALLAAMALNFTSCAEQNEAGESVPTSDISSEPSSNESASAGSTEIPVLGEGQTEFTAEVIHADGCVKKFTVKTDRQTLAEALTDVRLIEGEDSIYGLYVIKVNGESHKWEDDGMYWAVYVNGVMSNYGVSSINVVAGDLYTFQAK